MTSVRPPTARCSMTSEGPPLRTVLLVHGELDTIRRAALELEGYRVRLAPNRAQALSLAQALRPDCAVIEMDLPDPSRLDIVGDLRAVSAQVRIVITSPFASVSLAVEAIRRGAADYLLSPVATEELLATLRAARVPRKARMHCPLPTLERVQWEYIHTVLVYCDGNVSETARRLGIYRQSLQRMLRRHAPRR